MMKERKFLFILFFAVALFVGLSEDAMAITPKISAGYSHSKALKSDGTLWSWGKLIGSQWTTINQGIESLVPIQKGTSTDWKVIAAGGKHTAAIKANGTAWAWGDNSYGQLGNGSIISSVDPIQVSSDTNWSAISAGYYYTAAMKSDGTLWAWGDGSFGQLGQGTTANSLTPIQIGIDSNWAAVSAGGYHTAALRSNGTLWAWGYGYYGQLGWGTTRNSLVPVQVGSDTNWAAVSGGILHTAALKNNGTLWAWGYGYYGQLGWGTTRNSLVPIQVGSDTNWAAVSAGGYNTVALKSNGTLWAWGDGSSGQLGQGGGAISLVPIQVGNDTNWVAISTGDGHILAMKSDGTLWAWGASYYGQVGNNSRINSLVPVLIMPLSAGPDNDGDGYTSDIDCNDTDPNIHPNAAEIPYNGIDENCNGMADDDDLDHDGYGAATDCNDNNAAVYPGATEVCDSIDNNCNGQIDEELPLNTYYRDLDGDGYGTVAQTVQACAQPVGYVTNSTDCNDSNAAVNPGATEVCDSLDNNCNGQINEGLLNTYYFDADGDAYGNPGGPTIQACSQPSNYVGDNTDCNDAVASTNPGAIEIYDSIDNNCNGQIDEWRTITPKITAGGMHSKALKSDGTLWTWGFKIGGTWSTLDPGIESLVPIQKGSNTDWTVIEAGYSHASAIKSNGTVWTWGDNSSGQLGNGTTTNSLAPIQRGVDTNWFAVSAGSNHNLALRSNGALWAWGNGYYGQLGCGTTKNSLIPIQISSDTNWSAVFGGGNHSLALKSDGTLWAWGYGGSGQLGWGTTSNSLIPIQVSSDTNWTAVSAGFYHNVALKSNGTLWAWGYGGFGQLGWGTTSNSLVPIQVGSDTNWTAISAGDYFTLALRSNGTLWAWGNGYNGELGWGTTKSSLVPIQVGSDTNWTAISTGYAHALAMKSDNTLWAWGYNYYGQVGNNSKTNSLVPVQIMSLNAIPAPMSPSGAITDSIPTYSWNAVSWAASYHLLVQNSGGTTVIDQWYTSSQAGCGTGTGTCSVTPAVTLSHDSYAWYIQGNDGTNTRPWGNGISFSVSIDNDGDGYPADVDCNDNDPNINPGATEVCDGIDNNCNGQIDEGVQNTYYMDADSDSYGNAAQTTQACTQPVGYVTNSTDCNDANAAINPGATEICDAIDNNCNGQIDDGFPLNTYYRDADSDSYGNSSDSVQACTQPAGYVTDNTDCNDSSASVHPGATEIKLDGIDQDCNGYDLTIVITSAVYTKRTDSLAVSATSNLGSSANLVLVGYGAMKYKNGVWSITVRPAGGNPGTVTVSGIEGSTSSPVTVK